MDTAIKRENADNVTALVVQVTSDQPVPPATRRSLFSRRRTCMLSPRFDSVDHFEVLDELG